jgi:hypothetical protein
MKPSDTRMAGEVFQLKQAHQSTKGDQVFIEHKCFGFVTTIFNNQAFWNYFKLVTLCSEFFGWLT